MASLRMHIAVLLLYTVYRVQSYSSPPIFAKRQLGCTDLGYAYQSQLNRHSASSDDADTADTVTYFSPNAPLSNRDYGDNDNGVDDGLLENAASSSVNEYSFFDEAIIYVRAGSGGQGANTYQIAAKSQNGLPDGGNGGQGGSVYLIVDASLNTLAGLTQAWRPNSFGGSGGASTTGSTRPKSFRAENGTDGGRGNRNGRYGKDIQIRVPPGTKVQEVVTDSETETTYENDIGVVDNDNESLLVARGGVGGEGTGVQRSRGVRRPRQPSTGGDRKMLKLTLQIVADVALVGVPNAGKSTLLASVTRAKPKIANYPFTTVIPNLGVWVPEDFDDNDHESDNDNDEASASTGLVLCDVPGLIAGASYGVGLGLQFLRHVERCHVILHLVDATAHDPIADYNMLNQELCRYGTGQLANMPQVVVVTKVDAFGRDDEHNSALPTATEDWEAGLRTKWTRKQLEAKLRETLPHSRLLWISSKRQEGVDELMTRLSAFVKKVKENKRDEKVGEDQG